MGKKVEASYNDILEDIVLMEDFSNNELINLAIASLVTADAREFDLYSFARHATTASKKFIKDFAEEENENE
ncbi:hypothetical protein [Apilactobacillus timberlakei]|uniref:DUF2560 family protein n=1 Tax=Apilactobacillus timberlakei TaxID=2008380 RepID=A0ABY2YRK1_9LACO|nr:hypothetical protein [Apilactobacillus timberlakei]TPR12760.1 hypothetical protein DY048_07050 [Apilactobacillus timberlakei]TPR13643.1 hypothetical protein DY052_07920 [Apilactobacillus timberlakei]